MSKGSVMGYNDDEKMYENVTKLLGSMKKVSVPPNFDADLMRRINSEKYALPEPWWKKVFIPSRLIPAAGLALATIAVLFVLDTASVESENPLLSNPRVREDVVAASENGEEISPAQKMGIEFEENYSSPRNVQPAGYGITKSGLNFRQLHLTPEERAKIEKMKEELIRILDKAGSN